MTIYMCRFKKKAFIYTCRFKKKVFCEKKAFYKVAYCMTIYMCRFQKKAFLYTCVYVCVHILTYELSRTRLFSYLYVCDCHTISHFISEEGFHLHMC